LNVSQAVGIALTSFTSNLLEGRTLSVEEDDMVMWSAVSHTLLVSTRLALPPVSPYFDINTCLQTVSAIYSFFFAMTLFPDVQKKAQAEIDAVVPTGM
jgi:hypothetical protein